ncbi:MAG TPA: hypothetical protein HA362_03865 [Nanoarchaeota archaeon]|nr:hypothetical protein [Nanoarchaeota archaeon]
MDLVGLHRNMDDIVRQYEGLVSADAAERQRTEGSLVSGEVDKVLQIYEDCLAKCPHNYIIGQGVFNGKELPVLAPEEISRVHLLTMEHETAYAYASVTGQLVTELIRKSYCAGFNDFRLTTKTGMPLGSFGYGLAGTEERPIMIEVDGDLRGDALEYAKYVFLKAENIKESGTLFYLTGSSSKHVSIKAKSIGQFCGNDSRNISIEAESIGEICARNAQNAKVKAKSIGNGCGTEARDSSFEAETIGEDCGAGAKSSIFRAKEIGRIFGFKAENTTLVADKIGEMCGLKSKTCTFKSGSLLELLKSMWHIPLMQGNRMYHIPEPGKERRIWAVV